MAQRARQYNIVDLYAGTGGMGLAALSTPPLREAGRIVWAAENNPRYVDTIRRNYLRYAATIGTRAQIPGTCSPVDLSTSAAVRVAKDVRACWGTIDLMLAGPPCQGFSLANRRTRNHENPHNLHSLDVLRFVRILRPRLFILENVPGIRTLPTSVNGSDTTTEILQRRLRRLKYASTVMVLDAAEYGVPQFRMRSFLVAVSGFGARSLPDYIVPEPTHGSGRSIPFITVGEALSDLPPTENGNCVSEMRYASKPVPAFQVRMRQHSGEFLTDHITSRHNPYVLERYERIPPGGNWTAIRSLMTNYSDPSRTHLNIYQRLQLDAPARTIGNFRKSMTIHPTQNRGLSLREAARLQSIPDWIGFSDPTEAIRRGAVPGLNAYQQQIGNAVSYLLTEALVAHVVQVVGL